MSNIGKVVVDTNVFINNFIFGEEHKEEDVIVFNILLESMDNNNIKLAFSQDTVGELFYVFKGKLKKHFNNLEWNDKMCEIALIFLYSCSVNTVNTIVDSCADLNDNMFLKVAKQSQAKYLISDDLKSKMKDVNLEGTEVLTAKEFVDKYGTKDEGNAKDETAATEKENNGK